jgi:hypothetical protein
MEKKSITYKPQYFDEWQNPDDPSQTYYRYNGLYFEKDRKERNWERLPDIFTDKLPDDFETYVKAEPDKKAKKKK